MSSSFSDKNLISYSKAFCNRPLASEGRIETFKSKFIFIVHENKINILNIENSYSVVSLEADDNKITAFCLEDQFIVSASANQIIRVWDWKNVTIKYLFKCGHKKPVTAVCYQIESNNIITASNDTIKVYNLLKKYNIFDFKGFMGPLSFLSYIKNLPNLIITGCQDNNVRIWDTNNGKLKFTLSDHTSQVISFDQFENFIFTHGRDKTINIYRMSDFKKCGSILLFEDVECIFVIPKNLISILLDSSHVIGTIGFNGNLKFWKHSPSICLYQTYIDSLSNTGCKLLQRCLVKSAKILHEQKMILFSTHLADLVFFCLDTFQVIKHSSFNLNQILCLGFFGSKIIVSFDSPTLRIFESNSNNCTQILDGHSDTVLCFDYFDGCLVTAGKDEKIIYWSLYENDEFVQVAQGIGHIGSITSICISKKKTNKFFVSSSDDNTLKLWSLNIEKSEEGSYMKSEWSSVAHKTTISCVKISPKDKYIASGSHDKTVKIWSRKGDFISQLVGHKRQITSMDFSHIDDTLVTGSVDATIRIWSLTDFTCSKVFEGSDSSVCSVAFLKNGSHIVGGYSSGLIKIWSILEGIEIQSLEGHNEKVWALSLNESDDMVSGDSEGCFTVWNNITEIEKTERREKFLQLKDKEQTLSNYLQSGNDIESLKLSIEIKHSKTLYELFEKNINSKSGLEIIKNVITNLESSDLDNLLVYIDTWNKNTKYFSVAQIVLNIILMNYKHEDLVKLPNITKTIASVIPYSERHYARVDKCSERAEILSFLEYCTINKN